MSKVLIIYHSQSGNTEKMAKAVSEGAVSSGDTVNLKKAFDATADDLLNCDAVVFGTPNYFSYEAGAVKDFFDRTFFTLRGQVTDKPCAIFGSAGGGGKQALDSLEKMCNRLSLKMAFESVVAQREPSSEVLEECKGLGAKMVLS